MSGSDAYLAGGSVSWAPPDFDAGFERATYIALVLVFLTAVIGVGQIFYWIAGHTGVLRLSRIR